jgi:hypothetical protein
MLTQFDPDKGPLFTGEFTSVIVVDPAIPGHVPNLVIDPTKDFNIELKWKLEGSDVPLYLAALGGNWDIQVYAESIGPGPDFRIANASIPAGPPVTPALYATTLTVPAGTLPEENPTPSNTDPSGVYKIVVTVFLDSVLGSPGFDICGFSEGPIIKVENPE